MKRVVMSILVALLFVFNLILTSGAFSETFYYGEAFFEIPENFDLISNDALGMVWFTEDENTEVIFRQINNSDAVDFSTCSFSEAESYYSGYLAENDTDIQYSENIIIDDDFQGVEVSGAVVINDEQYPIRAFIFSTNDYIYLFEFILYDGDIFDYSECVDEIIGSLYIEEYEASDDMYFDDDFFEAFLSLIFIGLVIFAVVIIAIYFSKSNPRKKSTAISSALNEILGTLTEKSDEGKTSKSRFIDTKFELNGKNINVFNEKFTVGRKNDNFALNELEKERKDREKMFD